MREGHFSLWSLAHGHASYIYRINTIIDISRISLRFGFGFWILRDCRSGGDCVFLRNFAFFVSIPVTHISYVMIDVDDSFSQYQADRRRSQHTTTLHVPRPEQPYRHTSGYLASPPFSPSLPRTRHDHTHKQLRCCADGIPHAFVTRSHETKCRPRARLAAAPSPRV